MKAIRIFEDTASADSLQLPRLRLYADSAIGRDVMPLFIPDIPGGWHARVCLSVRVHRLGKNISPKFALRYVDALSLTALLLPDTDAQAWDRSGVLAILDSAVTTGQWHATDLAALTSVDIHAALLNGSPAEDGEKTIDISRTFAAPDLDIATHVSTVSRTATLRTGDILIIDFTGIDIPLRPDTHIVATIDDFQCLSLKIK